MRVLGISAFFDHYWNAQWSSSIGYSMVDIKQVVNDAIRRGLAPRLSDAPSRPYRAAVHNAKLKPGIDAGALNRLVDELEDEAVIGRVKKR